MRQLTAQRPLRTPADVPGIKLRLPVIPSWVLVWQVLGAETTQLPLTELYGALESGKVDASDGDISQIASSKLSQVQSHLMMTNHLVQTGGLWIYQPFLAGLPADMQALIVAVAAEASAWATARTQQIEGSLLEDLRKQGMQVVDVDAQSFRDAARPAVEDLFRSEWTVVSWGDLLAL
jgi:TRAP-type C4-dicarboxylate transport system substrate-binding protein